VQGTTVHSHLPTIDGATQTDDGCIRKHMVDAGAQRVKNQQQHAASAAEYRKMEHVNPKSTVTKVARVQNIAKRKRDAKGGVT